MKKQHLPTKLCCYCQQPYAWRKKWEKVWDEVKYCSKACAQAARKQPLSASNCNTTAR